MYITVLLPVCILIIVFNVHLVMNLCGKPVGKPLHLFISMLWKNNLIYKICKRHQKQIVKWNFLVSGILSKSAWYLTVIRYVVYSLKASSGIMLSDAMALYALCFSTGQQIFHTSGKILLGLVQLMVNCQRCMLARILCEYAWWAFEAFVRILAWS